MSHQVTINIEEEARGKRFEELATSQIQDQESRKDHGERKMMDLMLYESAKQENVDSFIDVLKEVSCMKQQPVCTIVEQVSPSGNSFLHVAAKHGIKDITKYLVDNFPNLINKTNFQGDTALHLAARAGKLDTTKALVNYYTKPDDSACLLRMRNEKGNTALHEAVIKGYEKVACFLVLADPEVSYYNKEDKSPLYLAVETIHKKDEKKMLDLLLLAIPKVTGSLVWPQGKSPAHSAVELKSRDILEQIAEKKPELIRVTDENGENPLHFASSIGYLEGVRFLLKVFPDGAIQTNQEGLFPIHVACKMGHVEVLQEFLQQWPDPMDFLNEKGQNILHVAAENGQENVVKHILGCQELSALLNEQDYDGNTPLHLATKQGYSTTVYALVRDKRVLKMIVNSENLTAYNLALIESKREEEEHHSGKTISNGKDNNFYSEAANNAGKKQSQAVATTPLQMKKQVVDSEHVRDEKKHLDADKEADLELGSDGKKQSKTASVTAVYGMGMTLSILYFYANPKKFALRDYLSTQSKPLSKKDIKSRIATLLVVAVLVAGVTFAGAVQLPGGGNFSDDTSHNNTKYEKIVEKNPIFFQFYVYFDMVALNASLMSAIILCWAQLYDIRLASHAVWLASLLIGLSIYMMCLAFLFAVAIAVSRFVVFFTVIIVMESILFLAQTLLSAPLLRPTDDHVVGRLLSPYVYFMAFLIYLSLRRFLFMLLPHKKEE